MPCMLRMLYRISFRRAFVVFTGLRIDSLENIYLSVAAQRSYGYITRGVGGQIEKAFLAVNVFRNKSLNKYIERFWAWYQNVFKSLIYCVLPKGPVWGEQQFCFGATSILTTRGSICICFQMNGYTACRPKPVKKNQVVSVAYVTKLYKGVIESTVICLISVCVCYSCCRTCSIMYLRIALCLHQV